MKEKIINNCKDFIEFIHKNKIESVLLGNGYLLSNKDLKNLFIWREDNSVFKNIKQDIKKIFDYDPEKNLDKWRNYLCLKVFGHYINDIA